MIAMLTHRQKVIWYSPLISLHKNMGWDTGVVGDQLLLRSPMTMALYTHAHSPIADHPFLTH